MNDVTPFGLRLENRLTTGYQTLNVVNSISHL